MPLATEHLAILIAAFKKASDLVESGFADLESGFRFGGAVSAARQVGRNAAFKSTRRLETVLEQELDIGSSNARSSSVSRASMYILLCLSVLIEMNDHFSRS